MLHCNKDKLAASFCRQVAARVQSKLCNCYLVTNHKTANSLTTIEAREKNKHRSEIIRFLTFSTIKK